MSDDTILNTLISAIQQMSGWEVVAVITAIAYVILAIKERIECWYFALISTAIYSFLFWDVNLLMESALQVYYIVMAFYGWYQWRHHSNQQQDLAISRWSLQNHLMTFTALIAIVLLSGYLLTENTEAALPYLDSFTTWASIITTYMVTKKVLENWLYWIVIDSVSIYLYLDRELYLTALLFVIYVIIAVAGYLTWYRSLQREQQCLNLA